MKTCAYKPRLPLPLLLAASLLLLGWFQQQHEITAHLDHDDGTCQICLFSGHLGDGALPSHGVPHKTDLPVRYRQTITYASPFLTPLFRSSLTQRGPPSLSTA